MDETGFSSSERISEGPIGKSSGLAVHRPGIGVKLGFAWVPLKFFGEEDDIAGAVILDFQQPQEPALSSRIGRLVNKMRSDGLQNDNRQYAIPVEIDPAQVDVRQLSTSVTGRLGENLGHLDWTSEMGERKALDALAGRREYMSLKIYRDELRAEMLRDEVVANILMKKLSKDNPTGKLKDQMLSVVKKIGIAKKVHKLNVTRSFYSLVVFYNKELLNDELREHIVTQHTFDMLDFEELLRSIPSSSDEEK
ncbi:hypothetical protein BDN72DRAFT_860672 [Pluteus cervinus]|uniref:Uncharacterized protein n=1 Tax=Pluteus cervinus TaxID=181527 RepID=A0ACD3AIL2_9AGAR|nr:hypothetical protein BDN72DRAFT_860672 [Pluteus cervinus]